MTKQIRVEVINGSVTATISYDEHDLERAPWWLETSDCQLITRHTSLATAFDALADYIVKVDY